MKTCTKCAVTKGLTEFDRDMRTPSRRTAMCIECRRRQNRLRKRKHLKMTHPPEALADPDLRLPKRVRSIPDGSFREDKTNGYILEMQRGHHRAGATGYVFQHILVAEQKYGFPITRDFTVHHRNAVRSDNRPENLELRCGNHGAGGDAIDVLLTHADLRARAIVILEQHGYRVSLPPEQSVPVASGL